MNKFDRLTASEQNSVVAWFHRCSAEYNALRFPSLAPKLEPVYKRGFLGMTTNDWDSVLARYRREA